MELLLWQKEQRIYQQLWFCAILDIIYLDLREARVKLVEVGAILMQLVY